MVSQTYPNLAISWLCHKRIWKSGAFFCCDLKQQVQYHTDSTLKVHKFDFKTNEIVLKYRLEI